MGLRGMGLRGSAVHMGMQPGHGAAAWAWGFGAWGMGQRGAPAFEHDGVRGGGGGGEQQQRGGEQTVAPRVEGVGAQQRAQRRHGSHHAVDPLLLQLGLGSGRRQIVRRVPGQTGRGEGWGGRARYSMC